MKRACNVLISLFNETDECVFHPRPRSVDSEGKAIVYQCVFGNGGCKVEGGEIE